MKKFIHKIFSFFAIPLIVISLVAAIFGYYLSSLSTNCPIPISIAEIYIGDSHIKKAINVSLLTNSQNFGANGESYYFSYYKIINLLNDNAHIEKINLGFSYHNLSYYVDNFIYGRGALSTTSKYFYMLPVKQKFKLLQWNAIHSRTFIKNIFNSGVDIIKDKPHFKYIGGYNNTFTGLEANMLSIDKRIQFQYFDKHQPQKFSEFNIKYLQKIIALCKIKNIELVMIKTPLHQNYYKQIPVEYINKYKQLINQNKLKVMDLNTLNLTNDCFTPDGDHLTQKGATLATKELIRLNCDWL